MIESIRNELIARDSHDQAVRAELAADGSLFDGYHPRMEAVHLANADRLEAILAEHGWPGISLVGEEGTNAAWRIAQHAISRPSFMKRCRDLIDAASRAGEISRRAFAYLDDRINCFEGRPQRYGTQLRSGPSGLEPEELVDPRKVESWRAEVGLPPLQSILDEARRDPPPQPSDPDAFAQDEREWRKKVGW